MNPDINQLQKDVTMLMAWKKNLESSRAIPLDVDQAFRKRFLNFKVIFADIDIDFPSVNAGNANSQTVFMGGAMPDDPVVVTPATLQGISVNSFFTGYVSGKDNVVVTFHNGAGSPVDLASHTYRIVVLQRA